MMTITHKGIITRLKECLAPESLPFPGTVIVYGADNMNWKLGNGEFLQISFVYGGPRTLIYNDGPGPLDQYFHRTGRNEEQRPHFVQPPFLLN